MEMPLVRAYGRDDDLIRGVLADGRPRLRTYAVDGVELVLGRGSRPEHELNLAPVLADRVPVRRRVGGGCAVVLDPGNAVISVALPCAAIGGLREHFARLTAWVIDGLRAIGLDGLRHDGISDIALGDRKVGGSCLYQTQGALFYSTTLLIEPQIDLMERYLPFPPREPAYRRHRAHREFVGDLRGLGVRSAAALLGSLTPVLEQGLDRAMRTDRPLAERPVAGGR